MILTFFSSSSRHAAPCKCEVVVYGQTDGKTIGGSGKIVHRAFLRAKDPMLCPVGHLARYLYTKRTTICAIDPRRPDYLQAHLFHAKKPCSAMSSQTHINQIKGLFLDGANINIFNFATHALRRFGARLLDRLGFAQDVRGLLTLSISVCESCNQSDLLPTPHAFSLPLLSPPTFLRRS